MPFIIYESQSAFVLEKMIADNIFVAYEIIHFLRKKNKGKKGLMSLKLNMSKAYDRVECDYLQCIMVVLGFSQRITNLIMLCVWLVSFSVLVNEVP